MNHSLCTQFTDLLEMQTDGDCHAVEKLKGLPISMKDGRCLFDLYEQWSSAFSYTPGRKETLTLILSLAKKMPDYANDDVLSLYREPEWQKLINLRGPVETILIQQCLICFQVYPKMGVSGYYEAQCLICNRCGNVFFRSHYDGNPLPACSCGENFHTLNTCGCPACGTKPSSTIAEMSPYEYFEKHEYVRGQWA
jgi:hypothetical protein